ncbi:substrate-binding domain-containing protein [Nostoc sp.]|uniref:substrate-binding domain-containing protein n=1 Tax=Nostoc sp. TaxID=1180 RepID=UPI003FA56F4E
MGSFRYYCFLVGHTVRADARISTASITAGFGCLFDHPCSLTRFIPLHSARYDLVILKEYLEQSPVQQFIKIFGHQKRAIAILCRHLVMWLID